MANRWMQKLAKLDGAVTEKHNPFNSVIRFPSPSVNFIFGGGWGLPRGYSMILYGPPKAGKCVRFDTHIVDPRSGKQITIEEAVKAKLPVVHSADSATGDITVQEVSDWYDSGIKPTLKFVLKSGQAVSVTYHHPFLTLNGWKEAGELRVGEKVAVPRSMPVFGNVEWSSDKCFILGALLADGGLTNDIPRWSKTDSAIRNRMTQAVESNFTVSAKQETGSPCTFRFTGERGAGKNPLMTWCEELEIDSLSKEKVIPGVVFQFTKECLREFLGAIFSGDGSAPDSLEYSSASEVMIDQLQHLLLRFGFHAIKKFRTTKSDGQKEFPSWRLTINQTEELIRFRETFPLIGEKWTKLNIVEEIDFPRDYLTSFPKEMWDIVRQECAHNKLTLTDVYRILHPAMIPGKDGRLARHRFKTEGGCSHETLARINSVVKSERLQAYLNSGGVFVEIVDIEADGEVQC